jgi:hypothetical protein
MLKNFLPHLLSDLRALDVLLARMGASGMKLSQEFGLRGQYIERAGNTPKASSGDGEVTQKGGKVLVDSVKIAAQNDNISLVKFGGATPSKKV